MSTNCSSCGNGFDAVNSVLAAQSQALRGKLQISIQATALNSARQQGAALVALIDSAARIGKGNEPGVGENIDAFA